MAQVLNSLDIKSLSGKNGLVIYFFPKAGSGPCSLEAHEFNQNLDKFKVLGFNVVGVSLDKTDKNEKFAAREGLKFPLVSDTQHSVTNKYGKVVSFFKATGFPLPLGQVANRSTIVVDPSGKALFNMEQIGNKSDGIKGSITQLLDKLAHLNKTTATKEAAVEKGIDEKNAKKAKPVKKPKKHAAEKKILKN